jgi:hypothetical protein
VQIKPEIFTLPRCVSADLFFSCCESVAALPLANCNEHVAEKNISRPHPPSPNALCNVPTAREVCVVKPLRSLARDAHARHRNFISSLKNCHTEFLKLPRSSPPFFLPRAPRLQAASSREIMHMQAGQCGNQSMASAATASTAAATTYSSAASACFTTRPRAASTCPARCSSTKPEELVFTLV